MKIKDYLSREELADFCTRSDWRGGWLVLQNWLIIIAIFTVSAVWTNPFTLFIAVVLLGGRQLGLAVLMHEAGHKTLFKTPRLNQTVGQWFGAYPILADCDAYGASHREHHRLAGTHDDPDLPNYEKYPISLASFRRKFTRDVTGRTGSKLLASALSGVGNRMTMRDGEKTNKARQGLFVNMAMLLVLAAFGKAELYLLWVVAYLTAYPLIARIRQIAEHANVPGLYEPDPRGNTRTTRANWLERLILAPNNVSYHIEHHLLPSVPAWRLRDLHQHLVTRGFYAKHPDAIANGYWDVLKRVVPEFREGSAGNPA
ncbi:MAG: fatty acid desaturase family protein [Pseudomonadota bacterium]